LAYATQVAPLQQPPVHELALQTHAPFVHAEPMPHATHALPPVPQVFGPEVWQCPIVSQQPFGHVLALHGAAPELLVVVVVVLLLLEVVVVVVLELLALVVVLLLDAVTVAIPPFPTLAPPLPVVVDSPPAPPAAPLVVVAGPCVLLVLCAPEPLAPPVPLPGLPHAVTSTIVEQSTHTQRIDSAMDSALESHDSVSTADSMWKFECNRRSSERVNLS
jgi:hypothetical protein